MPQLGSIPTEDTTYLTQFLMPLFSISPSWIDNKLDAVIAARLELGSPPHFKPVGLVKTLYAE